MKMSRFSKKVIESGADWALGASQIGQGKDSREEHGVVFHEERGAETVPSR